MYDILDWGRGETAGQTGDSEKVYYLDLMQAIVTKPKGTST